MIRVFTSYYSENNSGRHEEILATLDKNLSTDAVSSVCLFLEQTESPRPGHPKLVTKPIQSRPTYEDFFQWAAELALGESDVSVITNSDIYFDSTITALAQVLKPNQCAALARWDLQPDGRATLFDRNDSQDVWVFKGEIRPVVSDFLVGIPRCDNRILYELQAAGYEVINPAFSVRAFHLHAGERAEYPDVIEGLHVEPPYAYLWPHNLYSLPVTMWRRVSGPYVPVGWRPDWRRVGRSLPMRILRKLTSLFGSTESC